MLHQPDPRVKVNLADIIAPSSIRVIAGTMLPGMVGAWPYFALAYGKFPWIDSVLKSWPWAAVAAIILLAYCIGLFFNSLGAAMEDCLYKRLRRKPNFDSDKYWNHYLMANPKTRPIFHKYCGLLVTWLVFSRAMTVAIAALLIGTSWHAYCWKSFTCCELHVLWDVGILGCIWMVWSTWSCVKGLHDMRKILKRLDRKNAK